jgi:hypothetical protein
MAGYSYAESATATSTEVMAVAQTATVEPQQWTDADGNHWSQQADGTILYWNGTDWEHYQ